jgi:putative phosphoribosyl transferase
MRTQPIFHDRSEAGKMLAGQVARSVPDSNSVVLALPRGGVPVGFELALALKTELDIFVVRKLGLPGQEELAIGAIASGGVRVLNERLLRELRLSWNLIDQITAREERELQRREELYRQGRPALPVRNRTAILVDDGLATGASMKAATQALRLQLPKSILVAVPVAAAETCGELRKNVDKVICAFTPQEFMAVGTWYENFSQVTDEQVQRLLIEARQMLAAQHELN